MIDRKPRPLWPFLSAALIGLPVLYVASFGPACWISFGNFDRCMTVNFLYRPLLAFTRSCEPARHALEQYANLVAPVGLKAFVHNGVAVID